MRQVPASQGKLAAEGTGEVEVEEGVLVLKRIHVRLLLNTAEEHRATAERVHGIFHDRCPVYRSLKNAIAITTALQFT